MVRVSPVASADKRLVSLPNPDGNDDCNIHVHHGTFRFELKLPVRSATTRLACAFRPGSPWSGAVPCHEEWGPRFAIGSDSASTIPRSLTRTIVRGRHRRTMPGNATAWAVNPCTVGSPWLSHIGRSTPRGTQRADLTSIDPRLLSPRELLNGLPQRKSLGDDVRAPLPRVMTSRLRYHSIRGLLARPFHEHTLQGMKFRSAPKP